MIHYSKNKSIHIQAYKNDNNYNNNNSTCIPIISTLWLLFFLYALAVDEDDDDNDDGDCSEDENDDDDAFTKHPYFKYKIVFAAVVLFGSILKHFASFYVNYISTH